MAEQSQDAVYVYGVIKSQTPKTFGPIGIGGRGDEVYTIHSQDVAAVASKVPFTEVEPDPPYALAHYQVNEAVMRELTVLPMSFGTIFRNEADVRAFLDGMHEALTDVFGKVEGKLEFGLKVNWDKDVVLRDLGAASATTEALEAKAEEYVQEIYDALRDAAVASRASKPIGDRMIMNSAFLVDRDKTQLFDEHLERIAQKYDDRLSFVHTGPWPPYNFVTIRLRLDQK